MSLRRSPRWVRTRVLGLLLLLVSASAAPARATESDAAAFFAGLRAVDTALDAGADEAAGARLAALLDAHKRALYARQARNEVEWLDQRLRFRSRYRTPSLDALTTGQVLAFDAEAGELALRYTPDTLGDFEGRESEPEVEWPAGSAPENPGRRALMHPALFEEAHVRVRGRSYASSRFLALVREDGHTEFILGNPPRLVKGRYGYTPAQVAEVAGPDRVVRKREHWGANEGRIRPWAHDPFEKLGFPMRRGEPFEAELIVGRNVIVAGVNGTESGRWQKSPEVFGHVTVDFPRFESLEIGGRVQPSWWDRLRDRHRQRAFAAFRAREAGGLPGWFSEPVPSEASAAHPRADSRLPGSRPYGERTLIEWVSEALDEKRHEDVLERLDPQTALSPPVRDFLRAHAHFGMRDYGAAGAAIDRVLAADPEFASAQLMRGRLHQLARRFDAAEAALATSYRVRPDHAPIVASLTRLHLQRGEFGSARAVLHGARRRGVDAETLAPLEEVFLALAYGPELLEVRRIETPHFRIAAVLDEATLRAAGEALEAAHAEFRAHTGWGTPPTREPTQVWIFAGPESYLAHAAALADSAPTHTRGVYSGYYRQLLAWNSTSRAALLRTLRHEAAHQYLDDLAGQDVPGWLTEGFAENVELPTLEDGRWGPVPDRHRLVLKRRAAELPSASEVLRGDSGRLEGDDHGAYSNALALVRFLTESRGARRKTIPRLLEGLAAGEPYTRVRDALLEELDLEALDADFDAYRTALVGEEPTPEEDQAPR
ncbi:MAG: hypothetical protein AAF430_13860 [Myxococcota bacterium]